jgi:ATP/ADP translocase
MAYLPLGIELKVKGKAAAEVIGSKLGKSLGAISQSVIFTIFPDATFTTLTPILMGIFVVVMCVWILSVLGLSREYTSSA